VAEKRKKVIIRCAGETFVDVRTLAPFQDDIKSLSESGYQKLKASIEKKGWIAPIFVWKQGPKINIIDGHQRVSAAMRMIEEGWEIPPVPVVSIKAKSVTDAKEILLAVTSRYGEFDFGAMANFVDELDIGFLSDMISIEGFDIEQVLNAPYEAKGTVTEETVDPTAKHHCPRCDYEW